MPTKTAQLLRLARRGPVRARDLTAANIPRPYLKRLTDRNLLEHVGRGLYRLPDAAVTELHALAEVSKRVPHATICLPSALQVHGLTTEAPHAVWIMMTVVRSSGSDGRSTNRPAVARSTEPSPSRQRASRFAEWT